MGATMLNILLPTSVSITSSVMNIIVNITSKVDNIIESTFDVPLLASPGVFLFTITPNQIHITTRMRTTGIVHVILSYLL